MARAHDRGEAGNEIGGQGGAKLGHAKHPFWVGPHSYHSGAVWARHFLRGARAERLRSGERSLWMVMLRPARLTDEPAGT
jgi:hypothetical protein